MHSSNDLQQQDTDDDDTSTQASEIQKNHSAIIDIASK